MKEWNCNLVDLHDNDNVQCNFHYLVDLNDYNEEVLDEITIPNILLNLPARGADVAPADFALSLRSR